MTITELKELCDRLAKEREALAVLKSRYAACDLTGHQHQITLNVGSCGSIALSQMDHYYAQRLIRGRELIMLGVKKMLAAMIDEQASVVAKLEKEIADAKVTP